MEKVVKKSLLILLCFFIDLNCKAQSCDSCQVKVDTVSIKGIRESSRYDYCVTDYDSHVIMEGLYWKYEHGLHIGISSGHEDVSIMHQQFRQSFIVVLRYIESHFPDMMLLDVSSDLPEDLQIELSKQLLIKKWNPVMREKCCKLILQSRYVQILNECLLPFNMIIFDVEIDNIRFVPKKEFMSGRKKKYDIGNVPSRIGAGGNTCV